MLVLTRKQGERIIAEFAGITMVIEVCEIRRDKIRLGIQAPMECVIYREELQDRQAKKDG